MSSIVKRAVWHLLNALPDWVIVDRIEALLTFRVAHGRLPRRGSGLFNDRLFFMKTDPQWTEDPLRQFCSDKELAKIFIRGVLGWDAAPRTFAVVDRPEDVTEHAFPAPSIIKPTHLQGRFIHHDGSAPLGEEKLARIRAWFDERMYRSRARERYYKNLRPRVIAEEVVADPRDLVDWRLFCWKGRARVVTVDRDRNRGAVISTHYTPDWEHLDIQFKAPNGGPEPRPERLDEMLAIAEKLAAHFDFVRVDLYVTPDRIFVGELTHVPISANGPFRTPEEERLYHDLVFGETRPGTSRHLESVADGAPS